MTIVPDDLYQPDREPAERLHDQHAPRTPAELRAAIAELRQRGYSLDTMARALRCSPEAVVALTRRPV